jgi:hypothetical protein
MLFIFRGKSTLFLLLLFLLFFIAIYSSNLPFLDIDLSLVNAGRPTEVTGSFSLVNTSENQELCGIFGSYPLIGETWNLSVTVAGNSSSDINVSYSGHYIYDMNWWEGADAFQVFPDHSHSEIYISHYSSDFPAFPTFYISLVNSTGNSSGTFQLSMIFRGYEANYPFPCPGYVSNITKWLISLTSHDSITCTSLISLTSHDSSTFTSLMSPFSVFPFGYFVFYAIILVWYKRRKKVG